MRRRCDHAAEGAPNTRPVKRVVLGEEEDRSGVPGRASAQAAHPSYRAAYRAAAAAGFILIILLLLGMLGEDEYIPGERVPLDVARNVAAEEYDRILEEWGDPDAARRGAERVYEEVLRDWGAEG